MTDITKLNERVATKRDPLDLSDRAILISGAAGALGQVITRSLLDRGASVLASDVIEQDVADERLTSGAKHHYVNCDTADPHEVSAMFDAHLEHFGALPDTVCCHAGMVSSHPAQEFPLDEFDAAFRLNVRGAWVLATEAARRWINSDTSGLLIFTSSWVQDVPWPGIAPYNATKAAIRSMTQSFARELAPHGIRANAIAPGIVGAGMAKRQWDMESDYRARAERAIPLGYQQPPESVADAFTFMVSSLSSYMTGSVLVVDGGCSLYPMD